MDGGNGYGNRNTIGVEICRNYDRSRRTTNLLEPLKSYYSDAEKNAIKVIAQICVEEGIVANVDNIKKHQDWSGKWCPSKILNEGRWVAFRTSVIAEYNKLVGNSASAPVEAPKGKKYDVKVTINGYVNAVDAKNKKNAKTKVSAGNYHIYKESNGMINVSSKQGVAGSWINPDENKSGTAVAKPTPAPVAKPSKPVSKIVKSYNEVETMYPTQTIKVYPEPLEWGKEVATYYSGESVKYHKIHLGNGYLWLEYSRSNGSKGFIPFRTYNNGKYGTPKGTIGAPQKTTPKPVEKIDKKYAQKGTFYPNKSINVYNRPSKNGSVVATYYSGESVTYHTVHEGNGYVWLQYTRGGGKGEAYIPCRTYSNGKYGSLDGRIV